MRFENYTHYKALYLLKKAYDTWFTPIAVVSQNVV